uniref:Ig-like domain-containing protein n=1 Tax=Poecilia reticulata TaxID=8081 RepID=A0A3P9PH80_POERE
MVLLHIMWCFYFILQFLIFLSNADGLVPVITAHLGEATTLTCPLPDSKDRRNKLFWYRQTAGDTLEVIVKLVTLANPEYGKGYSDSRVKAVLTDKVSNLTILKAAQEDEGMYHCGFTDWNQNVWQGTYLLIKGNVFLKVFKNIHIIHSFVNSSGYVTLQCSILSDFENKTCSEDPNVFWFRSDKSHPDIIYTDGNGTNRCQRKIDNRTKWVYNFSKKISSSDDGTYYCAVATCGEILFGNGSKLEVKNSSEQLLKYFLSACIVMSFLFAVQNEDGQDLNYAALHFGAGKATSGKKRKEDSVYSQVKL